MMDIKKIKEEIIKAGELAVKQLVKVAKEEIIKPDPDDELAADRLKNAAATKKLAIFDAFEILNRIEAERAMLEESGSSTKNTSSGGFAERRSRKS
jgi:hypothetical protein|tara:strand:- start:1098 stop:1385 length:288 start_codon:yes stop_codon:yes gene_type:complete